MPAPPERLPPGRLRGAVASRAPPLAPVPRLDDDGYAVTLDLHGARVAEALDLAEDVITAAARAGRSTVRVVHGHSTSDGDRQTIKTELLAEIDRGTFAPHVASALRAEGHVLLGLGASAHRSPTRLRLADFW